MPCSSSVGSLSSSYEGVSWFCSVMRERRTMYVSPNTRHRPSAGSAGGWRFTSSSGKPGMRVIVDASPPLPCCCACCVLSASTRAILSGVKSFQNGGGFGNVDESVLLSWGGWSAIFQAIGGRGFVEFT